MQQMSHLGAIMALRIFVPAQNAQRPAKNSGGVQKSANWKTFWMVRHSNTSWKKSRKILKTLISLILILVTALAAFLN